MAEKFRRRNGFSLQRGGASKGEEIPNDSFQSTDLLGNEFAVSVGRRPASERFFLSEEAGLDRGQWITNFVRDAGGKDAKGSKLFPSLGYFRLSINLSLSGAMVSR